MKKAEAVLAVIATTGNQDNAVWNIARLGKTYPHITASWTTHWNELSTFYKYPAQIRRLIYTTNPIESLHSMIKKTIGSKGSFPSEVSAFKLLY